MANHVYAKKRTGFGPHLWRWQSPEPLSDRSHTERTKATSSKATLYPGTFGWSKADRFWSAPLAMQSPKPCLIDPLLNT